MICVQKNKLTVDSVVNNKPYIYFYKQVGIDIK